MRFSDVIAASLVAPLVAAHGGDIPGAPKVFGLPKHLRARNPWAGHQNVAAPKIQARQGGDANNRCGTQGNGASCAAGFCCSSAGYCGNTKEHCAAPDCQINFGPGCDANKTPIGATTRNDPRPQLGNIAYGGVGIRSCVNSNQVAITYDDGPFSFTESVLSQFAARGAKATFFITGNNIGKGAIDENWSGVIQKMYDAGHQIASHTWSHQNLDEITQAQRIDQMVKNEMAIRNIIGKYPTYMRPPYSACYTAACMKDMQDLGYVITSFDIDTDDYNQLTTEKIQNAKDNFRGNLTEGDRLAIAHDIHDLTANNLTPYMLELIYSSGLTAVTVGECMNDPKANWYRDSTPAVRPSATPSSSVPVPTPTGPTSTDGQCGSSTAGKGQSCIGFQGPDGISECCSAAGWCGRSADHCGTGCDPRFGKCGTQPSISASASASVSKTSSAIRPTGSLATSTTGECGASVGLTCKGFSLDGVKAECCSEYGWCGNTDAYCGATCNPYYGNCGSSGSSSSVSASATSKAASSTSKAASSTSKAASSTSKAASASVTSKAASSTSKASSSASASASKSESQTASSSASVSKHESSSVPAEKTSSASVSLSTGKSATPSASISKHDSTSAVQSTKTPDVQSTKTPSPSSSKAISSGSVYPSQSSSAPIYPSQSSSAPIYPSQSSSAPIYPSSSVSVYPSKSSSAVYPDESASKVVYPSTTFGTVVKPSSTPCDDDKKPTPTPEYPISKDGKCGKNNGNQTCIGYKLPYGGQLAEYCCISSGTCQQSSNDYDSKYSKKQY